MFNKKKKVNTKDNEKKTLLSQPEESYKSFVYHETKPDLSVNSSSTVAPPAGEGQTRPLSNVIEDDKLIQGETPTKKGFFQKQKKRDVYVRLHAKDIINVDAASATIQLQLTVYLTWEDKNYRNEKDGNLTLKVFDPEVEIFNEVKMKADATVEVLDARKNLIRKKIHFSDMHLSHFPFDEHRVFVFLRPSKHWSNHVELKFQDNMDQWGGMNLIGGSMSIGLPDWEIGIPEMAMQTVQRRAYNPDDRCSQIVVTIPMKRISNYYIWKFFAVIAIMTIMSWYTFKMDPTDFGDKMVINLTLFLSAVAFLFVIDKGLPKVPYFTVADKMITGSFLFLFLAATQNFVVWNLQQSNNLIYKKLDDWSCIAFPVASVLCVLIMTFGVMRKKSGAKYPDQTVFFRGRVNNVMM